MAREPHIQAHALPVLVEPAEGVPIPTIPADQKPVAGERIVVTVRVPTRGAPAPA